MKQMLIALTLLFAGLSGVMAQSTVKKNAVGEFKTIDLSGNMQVTLIPAQERSVEVEFHGVASDKLVLGVTDGVLAMRLKPGATSAKNSSVEVKIYYTGLNTMKASGAQVKMTTPLETDLLDIHVWAGATLSGELHAQDLVMQVSGNSAVDLTGATKYYTLTATSKSKVNTRELISQSVRVSAASGSEVYVEAQERLEIASDTGATVFYRGEPVILRTATKLMGEIHSIGQ